ncbi:MAG: hypothetical protein AVO34_13725 [Firmicutes bacterium ML8_F2]|jgi:hypothetical protein|nr:MAG: hypothetical protein AVO34_13725 [Firmicutes bacterium ML8_F2]
MDETLTDTYLTGKVVSSHSNKPVSIIPNPVTQTMAEFLFTFGFIESFEEYCLYTSVMDNFVKY